MAQGFMMHPDLLNAYECQRLPPAEFVRKFRAAAEGETNEFSKYVKPWSGRPNAKEWATLRTTVFARDDYTCAYCGERGGRLECDHIVPVAKGGSNDIENLTTACRPCNRAKRDKTVEEWRGAHSINQA
jgi:5-methylcytosine-specific restriction endonuclease McrA